MPDLTILGREVYFDRQLVAELHPSLVEGTTLHAEFLAALRDGARVEEIKNEIKDDLAGYVAAWRENA